MLADADENKLALLQFLLQQLKDGNVGQLLIAWIFLNIPTLLAFFSEWRAGKKIERLYGQRLADKDAEIQRLAARIKELENLTLKTKRA